MAHSVRLLRSGRQFAAEPGETILAAGLRQGLALPFGCRSGACASCRVRLHAGQVHHEEPRATGSPALSAAEVDAGYVLMCLAHARSDLTLDLHQPAGVEHVRPRPWRVRVVSHRPLAHDVIELTVKLPQANDGAEPFRFLPGQYVDFLLADGKRRSFSIAKSDAADALLEFHLRVTPDGKFAHYVRSEMPERTLLRLEGPFGAFYLREDSVRPVLLMAGGTGFAPIKAMLERQFARGDKRPFHLFWGARRQCDLYLDALARDWAQRHENFRYTPVLSEEDADGPAARGLVHDALLRAYPDLHGYEIYMAGPPAMIHAAKRAFTEAGLEADHLFYDSFDYAFETWPALG